MLTIEAELDNILRERDLSLDRGLEIAARPCRPRNRWKREAPEPSQGVVLDLTPRTRQNTRMLCRLRFVVALSPSSERILILVVLWYKATNFRGIRGDCRLAAAADFIRGISAGKRESSRLEWRTRIRNQWLPLVTWNFRDTLISRISRYKKTREN